MPNQTDNGFHHPLWVLYLLGSCVPPDQLSSFLGDLEELYYEVEARHGTRSARRYYRFQVMLSTVSFLRLKVVESKMFRALSFLHTLIEFVKKLGP
jgi:hypothetical protein